jgi:hypothetical protein
VSAKLPLCIFGAGALGHTWAVTVYGSVPGEHNIERLHGQASYGSDAARMLDEYGNGARGELYTATVNGHGQRGWRRVRRSAALLDQNPAHPYEPAVQP